MGSDPLYRKVPMRRNQMKRRHRDTGPSRETKNDVWRRAGDQCERCGRVLNSGVYESFSIHHRMPRGMGGTKNEWINDQSNLLLLCGSGTTGCHGWIERNRADSYGDGFLVHSYENPWDVPVMVHRGHPLRLNQEHPRVYLVARSEDR